MKQFNWMYERMSRYRNKNKSLSYNIERYLLDNGVKKKEIRSLKKILLTSKP